VAKQFGFAWVNANETTFGPQHDRMDEHVFSFDVNHEEGNFASMSCVLKNPRIGFLAPARKVWAWLSMDGEPLFFGRLVGVPSSINKELVTLEFIARPLDYGEQKSSLADGLRALPFYDEVFVTPEAQLDDDVVLEARPEAWHIDRITHEVTTSNILVPEDGVEEFLEHEVPYDSVDISIAQTPIRNLNITGTVSWKQVHAGDIAIGTYLFESYAGKSLIDDWPKPGANLGGGWTAGADSAATDNYNIDNTETTTITQTWNNPAQKHTSGDTLSLNISSTVAPLQGPSIKIPLTFGDKSGGDDASLSSTWLRAPLWRVSAKLSASYAASRDRKESVSFLMVANLQPLVTLPDDGEVQQLSIGGGDVGLPSGFGDYGAAGDVPIGDPRNRSYFSSDRGLRSLEYLLMRGRAQILMSSRAIEITFPCLFERAIELSCRKGALLHDRRLPGGQGSGKIIKYSFSCDGDTGLLIGSVTIGCPIGYGGFIVEVPGDPTYCDEDYVGNDYQVYEGQLIVVGDADVGYTVPVDAPNDDGLTFPLAYSQAVLINEVHGSAAQQAVILQELADSFAVPDLSGVRGTPEEVAAILNRATDMPKQVDDALKDNSVWLELKLKNVNSGPFNNLYLVDVTQLEIPQGINLEAGSTP
jgi:hypothetical protein